MAKGGKFRRKVSVRLGEELVEKIEHWRSPGLSTSDVIRLAVSLLPDSPDQLKGSELSHPTKLDKTKVKFLKKDVEVKLKDKKEALKTLQEW